MYIGSFCKRLCKRGVKCFHLHLFFTGGKNLTFLKKYRMILHQRHEFRLRETFEILRFFDLSTSIERRHDAL